MQIVPMASRKDMNLRTRLPRIVAEDGQEVWLRRFRILWAQALQKVAQK
jgi:hypothetical protein